MFLRSDDIIPRFTLVEVTPLPTSLARSEYWPSSVADRPTFAAVIMAGCSFSCFPIVLGRLYS